LNKKNGRLIAESLLNQARRTNAWKERKKDISKSKISKRERKINLKNLNPEHSGILTAPNMEA
jgi:hypothetical protein